MLASLLFALSIISATSQSINQVTSQSINVNVDSTKVVSRRIAPNYIGYSLEVFNAQYWFGNDTKKTKSSFVRMMNQLMFSPDQPGPVMRIGGNSADQSIWNPTNQPLPPNDVYSISPSDLIIADRAVRDINAKAIYDVNFRDAANPQHALDHIQAIDSLIGWSNIEAVEIGNECDLYHQNGIRSSNYTYAEYDSEFNLYVNAIKQAVPKAPIKYQGATFIMETWYSDIASYTKEHQKDLHAVSIHGYPLTHCNNNTVTIDQLMNDRASQQQAKDIANARLVQALDALDIPLYLGEGNSVSCSGMPGVSNAFASALWALDTLFNMVAVGVQRFNFHAQPQLDSYSAVTWTSQSSNQPIVQPLFYGHHVFAQATRLDAELIQTTINQPIDYVKVWSVRNREEINIVLLHKNDSVTTTVDASINITAPVKNFKFPVAEYSQLTAPSLAEQFNVTWAGRTWMNTKEGEPIGEKSFLRITPTVDPSGAFATYVVPLAPASGALLNIKVPRDTNHRHERLQKKLKVNKH